MPWLARQLSHPDDPLPRSTRGSADAQAAGAVTGRPAAVTAPLEVIQAPGWPGTRVAVTAIVDPSVGKRFACTASVVAIVRSGGMRCGRIHSGVTTPTAANMARVRAMAGTARRIRTPAVTP